MLFSSSTIDAKNLKEFKKQAEVMKWGLDGWSTKGTRVEHTEFEYDSDRFLYIQRVLNLRIVLSRRYVDARFKISVTDSQLHNFTTERVQFGRGFKGVGGKHVLVKPL